MTVESYGISATSIPRLYLGKPSQGELYELEYDCHCDDVMCEPPSISVVRKAYHANAWREVEQISGTAARFLQSSVIVMGLIYWAIGDRNN